ncbi:ParA family protein [Methylobacterium nigriterrae]|uniref:ParA family protein n=1 Tax=Methylobacterium nigriterrae TaxID=3127512 RepID=UPI003013CBB4
MTVAARKGGAGKSTLSILLAALFAHAQLRSLLIDTDQGQHTAMAWASRRTAPWPMTVAAKTVEELELLIAHARERTIAMDFCIIDTAAGQTAMTASALAAADIVAIPTRCDTTDRWAVRETVEAVRAAGKPFLVVPTAVPTSRRGHQAPDLQNLRADLGDLGAALWEGQLTQRRAISYDLAAGRVPSESDWSGATNQECLALWRRIMDAFQTRFPQRQSGSA